MSLLLTARLEKEIAHELSLTIATTHTYITELFRKFDVNGRAGLTALWLGTSSAGRSGPAVVLTRAAAEAPD